MASQIRGSSEQEITVSFSKPEKKSEKREGTVD